MKVMEKLPLIGTIPDMHSDSKSFYTLQTIYKQKALQDFNNVKKYVSQNDPILDLEIKLFCQNILHLRVLRYRSLEDELNTPLVQNLEGVMIDYMEVDPVPGNGVWYIILRAAERFHMEYSRYPGERKESKNDVPDLKKHTQTILKELNMDQNCIPDEYLVEMCRFGNAQVHSICAFIGGVAAQEIIKIITKQWVPLNNTFIYNAVKSSSCSFEI